MALDFSQHGHLSSVTSRDITSASTLITTQDQVNSFEDISTADGRPRGANSPNNRSEAPTMRHPRTSLKISLHACQSIGYFATRDSSAAADWDASSG
jgi:hypothetical protein